MADKEVKTQEIKEPVTDTIATKKVVVHPQDDGTAMVIRRPLRNPYFWLIIVSAVALALIIAGIIVAVVRHQEMQTNGPVTQPGYSSFGGRFGDGSGRGSYWSETSSQNGPTTTTSVTNYTYTSGVVTKVSNGSLTVAGNGKAQTIKTNSSTQYVGNTKPAVNDSVTILGTADSNGTITATQVQVDNE